ncbi:DUF4279 domain-containing protein [Poritiphilus flavus]|uniref:DUF4279 domain-containing protein n=1 Tax=Poritiphilus flavus TaxID=2697053 RepID=A0A6L9ECP5_9FLAO|nr:DUF4279 domain-containing protein [Poritiphilus flavus]NAS12393.1 DUF4279 domain-containing protein [Poritiphilus flavus]
MISGFIYCILTGETFDPDAVNKLNGIRITDSQKKGSIGSKGRYKGQEIPFSSVQIELENNKDLTLDQELDLILSKLSDYHGEIAKAGVSDIELAMNLEYTSQCNWEFSVQQMKKMVHLDIHFSISCYPRL